METQETAKNKPSAEAARRAGRRAMRSLRRKYDADDVEFLNITAMMDMMTILLVFMLKSFSSSSSNEILSDSLALPASDTAEQVSESVTVTLSKNVVLVDGQPVASVHKGAVDASEKTGGDANALIITRLLAHLKNRADVDRKIASRTTTGTKFEGAMTIIADKSTPYRLLTEVMYTGGEAEYWKYRLLVLEKDQQ